MYRMDNPVMHGKRGVIKAVLEILEEQIPKNAATRNRYRRWIYADTRRNG